MSKTKIEWAEDLIPCACGCGTMIPPTDKWGRPHRFVSGHNSLTEEARKRNSEARKGKQHSEEWKQAMSKRMKGKRNPSWKGGRIVKENGYILVHLPEHPAATSNGYVYEHRLIMEKHLGRLLKPWEVVHHIDRDRSNNNLSNLQLTSNSEHAKHHNCDLSESEKAERAKGLISAAKRRKKPRKSIPCACGCGKYLITPDNKGRDRQYIHGHNQRGRNWRWHCGDKNRVG